MNILESGGLSKVNPNKISKQSDNPISTKIANATLI